MSGWCGRGNDDGGVAEAFAAGKADAGTTAATGAIPGAR